MKTFILLLHDCDSRIFCILYTFFGYTQLQGTTLHYTHYITLHVENDHIRLKYLIT